MFSVQPRIPYRFVRERVRLSWREVRFGLENDLLDRMAPIEMAMEQVVEVEKPSTALLEIAAAVRPEPTWVYVQQLADAEPLGFEKECRFKWLYLVLAWVYEHREQYPDPLQKVEEVYADFDYPRQIAKFVGYMPMLGPDLGSREANERRLFERWKRYLDQTTRLYAQQDG